MIVASTGVSLAFADQTGNATRMGVCFLNTDLCSRSPSAAILQKAMPTASAGMAPDTPD